MGMPYIPIPILSNDLMKETFPVLDPKNASLYEKYPILEQEDTEYTDGEALAGLYGADTADKYADSLFQTEWLRIQDQKLKITKERPGYFKIGTVALVVPRLR